jgi:hypothetical protein
MIHDVGVPVDIYMLTVSEVKCGGKFKKDPPNGSSLSVW